ncbi:MAG: DUF4397 domain-containing protein [Sphingobacteriales bacterium]|nr:MAG: DUF4397 domain-containing protein [Sphingobacteriales bacterium]
MIKKTFLYTLGCLALLSSCKKDDAIGTTPDRDLGYISFTNANSSSKSLNILVDQKQVNTSALGVNTTLTGTYAGFAAGSRTILTRDVAVATPPIDYYTGAVNVVAGQSYSFFQYGVITGGALKGILLNTDRTPDANGNNAKVRFLNLSNGAPALDLVMVRLEATTAKDSVVLYSAQPSLATVATPDVAALSAYKSLAANKAANSTPGVPVSTYILRLKLAGTNTIVSSSASTTIVPGRNYTFYARGTYPATALSSVLDN